MTPTSIPRDPLPSLPLARDRKSTPTFPIRSRVSESVLVFDYVFASSPRLPQRKHPRRTGSHPFVTPARAGHLATTPFPFLMPRGLRARGAANRGLLGQQSVPVVADRRVRLAAHFRGRVGYERHSGTLVNPRLESRSCFNAAPSVDCWSNKGRAACDDAGER